MSNSHKRKDPPSSQVESNKIAKNSTSFSSQSKKVIEKTISSAPIKYNNKTEDELPASRYQLYESLVSPQNFTYHHSRNGGTSYQEAMRQAEGKIIETPNYVFPHLAKNTKPQQQSIFSKPYYRTAAGDVWQDLSLADWDENDYRIFVGDLGNEVSDELLIRSFSHFPSLQKAKVIRDKKSGKTKGFGFVSFKDPKDFLRALKEMNGKYIGNRPCRITKSNWKDREATELNEQSKLNLTRVKKK